MPEYLETGSKKPGRGMAQRSPDLIEAMREIAKPLQPITGRGIGYQLFTHKLIDSMARSEMARVYRLLKEARERGIIPWSWIVDETRSIAGTTRPITRAPSRNPIAATSGTSSRTASS